MTEAGHPATVQERRRDYHDRIAGLRSMSVAIVAEAAGRVQAAVALLREGAQGTSAPGPGDQAVAIAGVAEVDAEVLALLALQAPVARDLRVILSSRDIAHLGELCIGLAQVLQTSASRPGNALADTMQETLRQIGGQGADLLRRANGAWVTLDGEQAHHVIQAAGGTRQLLQTFFAELASLTYVPVDAAMDLGRTIRALERLTDHAVEIADRVIFAATGAVSGSALDALSN